MNDVSKWFMAGAEVTEGLRLLSIYAPNAYVEQLVQGAPARYRYLLQNRLAPFADTPITETAPARRPPADSGFNFRRQWPFLSRGDCPPELKILAADKITAYHTVIEMHEKLFECTDSVEAFSTAENLLENYRQNLQISAEFAYYKEHGRILGKHPVFESMKRLDRYRKMNLYDLAQEQRKISGSIWRVKSEIAKGTKPQLLAERTERLRRKEEELAAVNNIISEKGGR